jgi:hypothetical protein
MRDGFPKRSPTDTKLNCQVPLGRQPRAFLQFAIFDHCLNTPHDGPRDCDAISYHP